MTESLCLFNPYMDSVSPDDSSKKSAEPLRGLRWDLIKAGLILLACFWIYSPVYHGEWLWDDDYLLTNNPAMKSLDGLWNIWFSPTTADYLPLTLTALWVQWRLFGMDSTGYHIVSILLHAVGSCLVWLLLRCMNLRWAWLAGLVFAIHPLCVVSVSWISEIKNTLSLPFFLLAAIFYVRFDDTSRRKFYWAALIAFLAAMLSKSSVVMFPVLILLYSWWKRGRLTKADFLRSAPFFAISLALGLVTLNFQLVRAIGSEPIPIGGFDSRLAIAGMAIVFYLSKIVCPIHLLPIYPQWQANPPDPFQFAPWFFILGVALVFLKYRKSWGRHALMGFGFFFVTVLPVLGFVPMSYMRVGWVSDHFLYIPMIGILAYGISCFAWMYERVAYGAKVAFLTASPLVIGFLVFESHAYAGIWKNEDKMWLYTLQRHWNCWQAHNRYGAREFNRGHIEVALKHFLEATRLRPDLAETQNNLGSALLAHKDTQGAVACFSKALKMSPDIIAIQTNLARALLLDGQLQAAVDLYGDLAKRFPDNAVFQCNWGVSLYRAEQLEESIKCFRRALEIDPKLEDARTNLNQVLQEKEARINQVLQENNSSAGESDSE